MVTCLRCEKLEAESARLREALCRIENARTQLGQYDGTTLIIIYAIARRALAPEFTK